MRTLPFALVSFLFMYGCGFALFKGKPSSKNGSQESQEEITSKETPAEAASSAAVKSTTQPQTLQLNFVQSSFDKKTEFQGFKSGVNMLDAQTLLLWPKRSKLVSTKDPLKTEQASLSDLPRPGCNNAAQSETIAWVEDQSFWCLGGGGTLKRARFNAPTAEFVETETSIAKYLSGGKSPKIIAARPESLLISLGAEVLLVTRGEDPKQFSIERLPLPEKFQASISGGGVSAAPARYIWVNDGQSFYFRDLADASQQVWLEKKLVLKVGEATLGPDAEVAFFAKSWQKPELVLAAALWHEGHLYLSEGSVTAIAKPGEASGTGETFREGDPYWESKGRSLVQSNCTGCHQHSFGQNPPDLDLVKGARQEILRRTGLEPSSSDVMPPYGRPRVPAAQLKEFRDWLDRQD